MHPGVPAAVTRHPLHTETLLKTHLSRDLSMLLCIVRAAARDRILSNRVLLSWNTIWVPETPA